MCLSLTPLVWCSALCDPWPACPPEKAVRSPQRSAVLLSRLHQQGGVGHRTGRVPHPHGAVQRLTLPLSCFCNPPRPCTSTSPPFFLFFYPPLMAWAASNVSQETLLMKRLPVCGRAASFSVSSLLCLNVPHSADCWRSAVHYWISHDANSFDRVKHVSNVFVNIS